MKENHGKTEGRRRSSKGCFEAPGGGIRKERVRSFCALLLAGSLCGSFSACRSRGAAFENPSSGEDSGSLSFSESESSEKGLLDDLFGDVLKTRALSSEENLMDRPRFRKGSVGDSLVFDGKNSLFDHYKVKLRLDQVRYGTDAQAYVTAANAQNVEPLAGQEYVLADFSVQVLDVYGEGGHCRINSANFDLLNENDEAYPSVFGLDNVESKARDLRRGNRMKFQLVFQKPKQDRVIRICFLRRNSEALLFEYQIEKKSERSDDTSEQTETAIATSSGAGSEGRSRETGSSLRDEGQGDDGTKARTDSSGEHAASSPSSSSPASSSPPSEK